MKTRKEFNEPWLYRVFFREGQPIMAVLMGGSAQYEKEIFLDLTQYESFSKNRQLAKEFANSILKQE